MTRTEAREFMMQVFFQMEACSDFDKAHRAAYFRDKKMKSQQDYCEKLYDLLCTHKEELDLRIGELSTGWKLTRIPKTDLAVLRVALCEMTYFEEIPAIVSINEAVEIARKFGTDESARYVNGVLAKVVGDK